MNVRRAKIIHHEGQPPFLVSIGNHVRVKKTHPTGGDPEYVEATVKGWSRVFKRIRIREDGAMRDRWVPPELIFRLTASQEDGGEPSP